MFDYFYGDQSDQFSFYRVPKIFFSDIRFRNISVEAKLLYGLLLDRMSLSAKNGWYDSDGRVYIIYTIDDVKDSLYCAEKKAVKLLSELEHSCGLIERKRQGLGKPNLIFVKNFISNSREGQVLNCQNDNSGTVKNTAQELSKGQCSNTDYNNTEYNDTDSFLFTSFRGNDNSDANGNDSIKRDEYREIISDNISYDALIYDCSQDEDIVNEILDIIVDTVCTTKKSIRISGDEKPTGVVKSQFLKLNDEHIKYVMDGLKQNTTHIRNMRQYLLAALYNAPMTIGNYYRSLVNHDMAEERV